MQKSSREQTGLAACFFIPAWFHSSAGRLAFQRAQLHFRCKRNFSGYGAWRKQHLPPRPLFLLLYPWLQIWPLPIEPLGTSAF